MGHIRVGKPMVAPDTSAHTKGVEEGNAKGSYGKQSGFHPDGTVDSRRSTGIVPKRHQPILSVMPNLPPG